MKKIGRINRGVFGEALNINTHSINEKQLSIADDNSISSAFYNAPTVITIFAPEKLRFGINDSSIVAQNIMLAAWSLGIGNVFVGRAEETFSTEEGKKLMQQANINSDYVARVSICLGYPDAEYGSGKARNKSRILFIK